MYQPFFSSSYVDNMENKIQKLSDQIFKSRCLFETKGKQRDFNKNFAKVRELWSQVNSKSKMTAEFRETNAAFVSDLKQFRQRLGDDDCRRQVLRDLRPFIKREAPEILESGGAYQLYMMKTYLNGFLSNPSQYEDMIINRVLSYEMDEKSRRLYARILMREITNSVKIIFILVKQLEKMRPSMVKKK